MSSADDAWKVSPACDLTLSFGSNGAQSTAVLGEGKNPDTHHFTKLEPDAKIPEESYTQHHLLQTNQL